MIEDKEGGGAEVSFQGPVNALLAQALMPRMTYVPGTLRAMSEDMPDYASIAEFMEIRAERNAGCPNPQDRHGWRVNMKFNNELVPWLPPFNGDRRENPKNSAAKNVPASLPAVKSESCSQKATFRSLLYPNPGFTVVAPKVKPA